MNGKRITAALRRAVRRDRARSVMLAGTRTKGRFAAAAFAVVGVLSALAPGAGVQGETASADVSIDVEASQSLLLLDYFANGMPFIAEFSARYDVSNDGPDSATGVRFTAARPSGDVGGLNVSIADGDDADAAADWTCTNETLVCEAATESVLPGADLGAVTFDWVVNTAGPKNISATVESGSSDPDPDDNTARDFVNVIAAPETPVDLPDYTITEDTAMCGTFRFGTLTVPAGRTLRLATNRNLGEVPVPPTEGSQVMCESDPNSSHGAVFNFLRIDALRIIVNGTIDATGTQTSSVQPPSRGSAPSGNGGGGHYGSGGAGSLGTGGDGFTDAATRLEPQTEPGAPGAGDWRGPGGGAVILRAAEEIVSSGTIRADGTDGGSDHAGRCGSDDPDDPFGTFEGSHARGGGGAGGGVVLATRRLDLSGLVSARGGDGGFGLAGGGGGGGGGVAKLLAPVQVLRAGFAIDVGGGNAGGACTVGDSSSGMPKPQGAAGAPGDRVDDATPHARAFTPTGIESQGVVWAPRSIVRVPIDAAASYSGASPSGFTVYMCGVLNDPGFGVPAGNSVADPCGAGTQLASKSFSTFDVGPTDANGFVNISMVSPQSDGVWSIWAVAVRGSAISTPPEQADAVFGIDGAPPVVTCDADEPVFELNQAGAVVSATVADALSGPVESTLSAPADTSSVGVKTVPFTGHDLVGNEAILDCRYLVTYVFAGFFAPVDNPTVLNVANAGRSVPVKYRLTDANGTPVSDTANFVRITSVKATCDGLSAEAADAIESYSGTSGLQSLGDGYWQLNWATPKSYASTSQGPCRTMTVELLDTTKHTANFRFK